MIFQFPVIVVIDVLYNGLFKCLTFTMLSYSHHATYDYLPVGMPLIKQLPATEPAHLKLTHILKY